MTVTTFGAGGTTLPSLTGNTGKYLSTNGLSMSWNSVPKGMYLIQNQTTSGSSLTFSNIPSTYSHLKIIGHVLLSTNNTVSLSTNGFSNNGSSYLFHSSGVTWTGGTSSTHYVIPYTRGEGTSFDLTIPNYLKESNKAWNCIYGNVGGSYTFGMSGGSFNCSLINTLYLNGSTSGNWNVSLYGLD